jgi:hypothetical protein
MPRKIDAAIWLAVTAILLAALLHAKPACAEAHVSGNPDAVRVDARDAAVDEVMAMLGENFGLQYRSPASLNRRITGTFEGSLQQVVTRLLSGYDFVMKTDPSGVEVWVYGALKAGEAVTAPKPAEAAKPVPAAKVRHEARRKRHAL